MALAWHPLAPGIGLGMAQDPCGSAGTHPGICVWWVSRRVPATTLAMRKWLQQHRGQSREVAGVSQAPKDVFKPLDPAMPAAIPTPGFLVI